MKIIISIIAGMIIGAVLQCYNTANWLADYLPEQARSAIELSQQ